MLAARAHEPPSSPPAECASSRLSLQRELLHLLRQYGQSPRCNFNLKTHLKMQNYFMCMHLRTHILSWHLWKCRKAGVQNSHFGSGKWMLAYLQRSDFFLCQVVGCGTFGPQTFQAGDTNVNHVLHQFALLQGFLQTQMMLVAFGHILLVHNLWAVVLFLCAGYFFRSIRLENTFDSAFVKALIMVWSWKTRLYV